MLKSRNHRRIVAIIGVMVLMAALSGFILGSSSAPRGDGGYSHMLFPTQWGYGSGSIVSIAYSNGVPTKTERYAFEKHGYYEIRYPCDQTGPCR